MAYTTWLDSPTSPCWRDRELDFCLVHEVGCLSIRHVTEGLEDSWRVGPHGNAESDGRGAAGADPQEEMKVIN